ncbi:MAG: hypothetical protein COT91_03410 [Candidatus Doudnabacteria bacterium CG10_big_fil_rev_8_21_14_0_10_41_10]|uniref:Uncharacterized protein n=1 Tax=Candidatus Doudnabacteria bacterium CG10_big_fil_rev_8_21_14_0_10_41_10 TaxID=1974551 RepID=A0A2H0VFA2_9BACT|nr:MAG: hypothetical protein COT91_03410 [Candidatus Doudnabacteria bacterium CG10_big_fil_rev_8_21_14_0_10_41_10]
MIVLSFLIVLVSLPAHSGGIQIIIDEIQASSDLELASKSIDLCAVKGMLEKEIKTQIGKKETFRFNWQVALSLEETASGEFSVKLRNNQKGSAGFEREFKLLLWDPDTIGMQIIIQKLTRRIMVVIRKQESLKKGGISKP